MAKQLSIQASIDFLTRKINEILGKVEKIEDNGTVLPNQFNNAGKFLSTDGVKASWKIITSTGAGVPAVRTITINGVTHDLSVDRSWTISGGSGSSTWGGITGSLSNQTDLQNALNLKASVASLSSEITNRSNALNSKVDKITGKSLISDTEITKLASITGTNTGDETSTSIKSKLGITTLSGSNTGDQDISGITVNAAAIGALSSLNTSTKANLVSAINEVKAVADTAAGGGTIVGDGTVTNAKLATDVKVGSLALLATTNKTKCGSCP
jgi:hypothetical protein